MGTKHVDRENHPIVTSLDDVWFEMTYQFLRHKKRPITITTMRFYCSGYTSEECRTWLQKQHPEILLRVRKGQKPFPLSPQEVNLWTLKNALRNYLIDQGCKTLRDATTQQPAIFVALVKVMMELGTEFQEEVLALVEKGKA